jgi:SAM-dependent methyltransferase
MRDPARELSHNRLAAQFDQIINPYDLQRRLEVLIEEFLGEEDLAGQVVLDAGCGAGQGTGKLLARGAQVIALDLGPDLVALTRARHGVPAVVGDLMQLPFPDDHFRYIFSSEVIEHTPQSAQALAELYRVLRPGGHLVLSTPNWLWQYPVRLASALGLRPYDGLENFLKPGQLRGILEALGGQTQAHVGIHLLPFQVYAWHSLLRRVDRYGAQLLPLMINQAIHIRKP